MHEIYELEALRATTEKLSTYTLILILMIGKSITNDDDREGMWN